MTTTNRWRGRTLLAWNSCLFLLVIAGAWFSRGYYTNFFFGPYALDDAGLLRVAEQHDPLVYVELHGRTLIPTMINEVVTIDDKPHTSFPYFLMPVGDRLMLVLARGKNDESHLLGPVYRCRQLETKVLDSVVQEHPEYRGRILPVMLNATAAFTVAGYLGLAIFTPILLLTMVNLVRAAFRDL